jgi:hypothetical protein
MDGGYKRGLAVKNSTSRFIKSGVHYKKGRDVRRMYEESEGV